MFHKWKEKFDLSFATGGVLMELSDRYTSHLKVLTDICAENAILGFMIKLCTVVSLAVLAMKITEKYIFPSSLLYYLLLIFIVIFPYFFPYLMGEDPSSSFFFGVWTNFYLILFGFFVSSISKR